MSTNLSPDDIFSRFLFHSKEINSEKGVVKTSVFTGKHPNGFSVFHTTGLTEQKIWNIASNDVNRQEKLRGRCDLAVKFYQRAQLEIILSEPPERHYNIIGMPVGSELEEAEKLSLRQEMVANSSYHPAP